MNTSRRRFLKTMLGVSAAGLLAACAPPPQTAPAPNGAAPGATKPTEATAAPAMPAPSVGGKLVVAQSIEPDTLDQHATIGGGVSVNIMNALGGTLVAVDEKTGEYVPYLAESWSTSADGLAWTFKLRKDVKFHNGDALTAQDWVYSFERIKSDPFKGGLAAGIIGTPLKKAEAVDDNTLKLTLEKPLAPLLYALWTATVTPVSKAAVEKAGNDYGRNPVGVGPFKFKEWVTGNKVVLERNPDFNWAPPYAKPGPPNLQTLEFRIIPEAATVLAGIDAGEIDVAQVQAKDAKRIVEAGKFQLFQTPLTGQPIYLQLAVDRAPFNDVNVRRALNYAADREALLKVVALGFGQVQGGPLTSADVGYSKAAHETDYKFDLPKAQALMKEAGYADKDGDGILEDKDGKPLKFVMKTPPDPDSTRTAEVMKEQYKTLGFEIEIQQMEAGAFYAEVGGPPDKAPDMSVMGVSYGDVDLLYLYHSSGPLYVGNVKDAELDTLLDATRTAANTADRLKAADGVQRRLVDQAWSVWLFAGLNSLIVNKRVNAPIFVPFGDSQYGLQWFNAYVP